MRTCPKKRTDKGAGSALAWHLRLRSALCQMEHALEGSVETRFTWLFHRSPRNRISHWPQRLTLTQSTTPRRPLDSPDWELGEDELCRREQDASSCLRRSMRVKAGGWAFSVTDFGLVPVTKAF